MTRDLWHLYIFKVQCSRFHHPLKIFRDFEASCSSSKVQTFTDVLLLELELIEVHLRKVCPSPSTRYMRSGALETGLVAQVVWFSCIRRLHRRLLRPPHRRGLRVAGNPALLSSQRRPARDPLHLFRTSFATTSPHDSSDHWLEESCDVRRVGSRSVAMSQAAGPSPQGGSPPAISPPPAPAGRRRSALIAVACERCRRKKAKVRCLAPPSTRSDTWNNERS